MLTPESELILTKNEKLKTEFTVVAVKTPNGPVLLHTQRTNDLVQALLEKDSIPSLKGYSITKREATYGKSRFDFLLRSPEGTPFFLEVKSCTLFGNEGAMFPDAPSSRATRHVSELGSMSREGMGCGILFVVHSNIPRWFCPEYHTDPDFARTIAEERDYLKILSLAVKWDDDLKITEKPLEIPINWGLMQREFKDKGGCLALFNLSDQLELSLQEGDTLSLERGYWILVTGASKSLQKILSRLKGKRTKNQEPWDKIKAVTSPRIIPFRASKNIGLKLKKALSPMALETVEFDPVVPKEPGATLFKFSQDPMKQTNFIDVILRLRIDEPDKERC